jgi:hypothetical protein
MRPKGPPRPTALSRGTGKGLRIGLRSRLDAGARPDAGPDIVKGVALAPTLREQFPSGASELLDLLDNRVCHRRSR